MADNVADLLDGTLDDLADLPEFKVPPTGAYATEVVHFIKKKIGNHEQATELKLKILSVEELADDALAEGEQAPVSGEECSVVFMLDNDTGQGFFKMVIGALAEKFGKLKNRELMEMSKGANLLVVLKRTFDKEKERHYLNLKKVAVL